MGNFCLKFSREFLKIIELKSFFRKICYAQYVWWVATSQPKKGFQGRCCEYVVNLRGMHTQLIVLWLVCTYKFSLCLEGLFLAALA